MPVIGGIGNSIRHHIIHEDKPIFARVNVGKRHIIFELYIFFEMNDKENIPKVLSKGVNIPGTKSWSFECIERKYKLGFPSMAFKLL